MGTPAATPEYLPPWNHWQRDRAASPESVSDLDVLTWHDLYATFLPIIVLAIASYEVCIKLGHVWFMFLRRASTSVTAHAELAVDLLGETPTLFIWAQ